MEDINVKRLSRMILCVLCCYCVVLVLFYIFVGKQLNFENMVISDSNINNVVEELMDSVQTFQTIHSNMDKIEKLTIPFATFERANKGIVGIEIKNLDTGEVLSTKHVDVATLTLDQSFDIYCNDEIQNVSGATLA